jgi:hypothetical protein
MRRGRTNVDQAAYKILRRRLQVPIRGVTHDIPFEGALVGVVTQQDFEL